MEGQFPLYLHLKNEISREDDTLTIQEKDDLIEQIKMLDEQGCSLVYALIRYFQIYEDKTDATQTPYGMKKIRLGYKFCLEEMPPLLVQLIKRFVGLHLESSLAR